MITMRRLNRRKYKNTLRELSGVEINVSELPSDSGTGGFDTRGPEPFYVRQSIRAVPVAGCARR